MIPLNRNKNQHDNDNRKDTKVSQTPWGNQQLSILP